MLATNGDDGTPDDGSTAASRRRGIALISVLWVLILLSLIAGSFSFTSRTEVNLARNMVDNAEAEALADAGVYRAIAGLYKTVAEGGFRVDRTVYAWRFEDQEVRFEIADEGGKIDLNRASDAVLGALFRTFELSDQEAAALVDAIGDFRDADDNRRLNGAEDDDYLAAGLKHDAKDGPFEAVEELQQVLGMDRDLYRLAAPTLTVYSRRRAPHRAAPPVTRPPDPPPPETLTVYLRQGETLIGLARSHLGDGSRWREILSLNGWTETQAEKLPVGTKVQVPLR